MDLLRFVTAGNVDDGKSTLIGRLLLDSKAILEDQLAAIRAASASRGGGLNLALLTDGLKAEREQGITIDVAYRYFATPRRKFIVADCPGHLQYMRNMVTGASTADAAVVLVDVEKGLAEQTRRHCSVAALLRIPHLVIGVNKMDRVDYAREAFEGVRAELASFARRLEIPDLTLLPISALHGDNIVSRSAKMPWHEGPSLLEHLEALPVARDAAALDLRFPIQRVMSDPAGGRARRGYAGTVASGSIRKGDDVVALPSGAKARVAGIELAGRPLDVAAAGLAVTLRLEGDVELERGDLLAPPDAAPRVGQELEATVFWLARGPLVVGRGYILQHTTNEARASVDAVVRALDIDGVEAPTRGGGVGFNDLARVRLRASRPLCHDPYKANRATGSFVLIDPDSFATVAAGLIV